MPRKSIYLGKRGHSVLCTDRQSMKSGHPAKAFLAGAIPTPPAGWIDWTFGGDLPLPILGNDTKGNCQYCLGCHACTTWTANVAGTATGGTAFNEATVITDYLVLDNGQDVGLSEGQLVKAFTAPNFLGGVGTATVQDTLNINPVNAATMRAAIYYFGGVGINLALPDSWYADAEPGALWDVPATPDPSLGHAVWLPGVDASGVYGVATWGFELRMTQEGLISVDPTAFVFFSQQWFNANGYAPNGLHISVLAQYWVASGGSSDVLTLVSLYPPATGPTPTPTPNPTPPLPTPPMPTPTPSPVPASTDQAMLINFTQNTIQTQNITFRHTWNPKGTGTIEIHESLGTMAMPQKDTINGISFPN